MRIKMNFREAAQISDAYEKIHDSLHTSYADLMPVCESPLKRRKEYILFVLRSDLSVSDKTRLMAIMRLVEQFVWNELVDLEPEGEDPLPANSIEEVTPDLT